MRRLLIATALAAALPSAVEAAAPPSSAISAPAEFSYERLAEAFNSPSLDHVALFAPGSAAATYYESALQLSTFDALGLFTPASNLTVSGEQLVSPGGGPTIGPVTLDDNGLIVDVQRNGRPVSETVFPIGLVVEGADEGAGVVGTIHSVRYFDDVVQIVTITDNQGDAEAYVSVDDYVTGGRQLTNVYASPIRPGLINANVDIFEGAGEAGGTAYGHIWADGIGVTEFEFEVPPAGAPAAATTTIVG